MLKTQFAKTFYLCNSFLVITSFTVDPISSHIVVSFPKEKDTRGATYNAVSNMPQARDFYPVNRSVLFHSNEPQIKLNKKGALFVKKYIKNSAECLIGVKKRSVTPFNIIDSVFSRYDLPVELKYLAVIESELKPAALSRVGARGPWQLMAGTALDLGLKITRQCDERIDYYKSTGAAAKYLRDLYAQFGDWLLVLAAYNAGPKPVYAAIRESGSKNFWILQNYLPAESRDHVKKFIATHYYFEGRGSETTLTRSENRKYKKTKNAFAFSRAASQYNKSEKDKLENIYTDREREDLVVLCGMKQKAGSVNDGPDKIPQKNQPVVRQFETSKQKFDRLMKESAGSLKRSGKLI
jgi:membrane-bound lytic murein transglycosylase D